jgi:predicted ATPase
MLHTLAVAGYRTLREVVVPLGPLTLITGPNGSGKSNLYRAIRLLSETALGGSIASLAAEGGLPSVLWAGPESFARSVKQGEHPVQGGPRTERVRVRLGFSSDEFSYAVDFGLPVPVPGSVFTHDPEIKRECIWHGRTWRSSTTLVNRKAQLVQNRGEGGAWNIVSDQLAPFDSMLTTLTDPERAPEILALRDSIRSWRFYDQFRTDRDAPARQTQIGTRTPVLSHDGRDLAAALQTIREIGDAAALDTAVADAFDGARIHVRIDGGTRFGVELHQHGLLRPLNQAELSDGTLRYLLWIAALLTPRPPALMVLNEPETSLHPDLMPSLARLIEQAAERSQLWVVSHSAALTEVLNRSRKCIPIVLHKELGETRIAGQTSLIDQPSWAWPPM